MATNDELSRVRTLLRLNETPKGSCRCGCGEPTGFASRRQARELGINEGDHLPFVAFHCKRLRGDLRIAEGSDPLTACWHWTGPLDGRGRPVQTRETGSRATPLRRVVYEGLVRPLSPRHEVRMRCGTRACLNPAHMHSVLDGTAHEVLVGAEGLCLCGCGEAAPTVDRGDLRRMLIAGMPAPFASGHRVRRNRDYVVEIDRGFVGPCHEHQGARAGDWYADGPDGRAHRAVFVRRGVSIAPGWVVHHECHNPPCCNPDHLRLVPEPQNIGRRLPAPEVLAVEEVRRRYPSSSIARGERRYAICELGFSSPCWVWLGGRTRNGYPVKGRPGAQSKERYAHRRMWAERNGEIPTGLDLDHLCGVSMCVNPDHLEPVTRAENHRRRVLRQVARARAEEREEAKALDALGLEQEHKEMARC